VSKVASVHCIARLQICYSCCHYFLFPKPQSDDFFDLDEVFAEYFMSEPDELVAYTNSMVNCGGTANDIAMDQVGSTAMDEWKPTPGPGNSVFLAMGGNKAVFSSDEVDAASRPPPTKKVKQEEGTASCLAAADPYSFEHPDWHIMMNQYQQMLNQDQQVLANQQDTQQVQHHHAQQLKHIIELQAHQAEADASATLPVGVGSHLGDIGDIVPATVQSTPCEPMVQSQYTMEEYGSGAIPDHDAADRRQKKKKNRDPDHEAADRRQKKKNRDYAKQFRARTKSIFESLREELESLKVQNQDLRSIVQEHIPEHAMQIIAECSSARSEYSPSLATPTKPLFAEADNIEQATTAGGGEQPDLVVSDPLWSKRSPKPLLFHLERTYQ
jgi:hypothetical protein